MQQLGLFGQELFFSSEELLCFLLCPAITEHRAGLIFGISTVQGWWPLSEGRAGEKVPMSGMAAVSWNST